MSGKWHLGLKPENGPSQRGFDRSFALLPGRTNHFGFEPQFENPMDFFVRIPVLCAEDGKRKVIEANKGNEYDTGFFSSEYYASNLINYFKERTVEQKEQPFFAFLPFSAPHWPLQCSKEDRERYRGVYDECNTLHLTAGKGSTATRSSWDGSCSAVQRCVKGRGRWSTCRRMDSFGKNKWELFDLSVDPGETNDLAGSRPHKLRELFQAWHQYVLETGTVWGEPVSARLHGETCPRTV
ncbi:hypothetical protein ASPVEDRAFT_27508 [Aspergillus versicolor CBS 583.65]|uniref:Sulfatase N-terminal domain-containing protein n=1 Tax=Aspergillus versicolor CBS 583.65 TaxID=1036611 RepID=A0A1L9PGZ5_ASPVE|nr:uncharacterized protein ASPVEDRAFT_27508 [Aspergillus versicolor CBS 583.65]OJJ00794.1 hypothetical protein ASPVEDRAFT_27508 [Aspergillus versicolor CBS 583.65]